MYNEVNASPIKSFFHQKWVRIILVLNFLAILVVIGIAIYSSTKTAVITFNIAPTDATIMMNGSTYQNGTYKLHPGTYDITISHSDLDQKTFHLDLPSDSSTHLITFLSATDEEGNPSFDFYTLKTNQNSYQALTSIASSTNNQTTDHDTSAEEFIARMEKTLSIKSILPIKGSVYAVSGVNTSTAGYSIRNATDNENCQTITCLLVMYYGEGYKDAVATEIQKAGYNPAGYELIYERYK